MFIDRLLVLLVFAVSVAESDVYTDVALAIELAATGSHQYIALFGNVLICVKETPIFHEGKYATRLARGRQPPC